MWLTISLLLACTPLLHGQSTSSYTPVPTASAVPGDYAGQYRPQIHYSPPQGFMNDPNGMFVDAEGVYHLYYQLNPTDTIAGNQHWGHATSKDLYHWTNQAIALSPSNGTDFIFSGSAVVDVNNTSGFFPNQTNGVVAMYTLSGPDQQNQNIAYSLDGGYTFIKYAQNPVLQIGSTAWRDPKVIWYEPTSTWVVVIAFALDSTVGIYTSTNLIKWKFASNFSGHGITGIQWECPNMVEMPVENSTETMWLMYVSLNPGSPAGGSIAQYFPGTFNGTHFTAVDSVARVADFGKDNYAGQFFYGIPGTQDQVSIAWASNWQYCNLVPTGPAEGWQSALSLPRINYLTKVPRIGYQLVSKPYRIATVQASTLRAESRSLGNGTLFGDFTGGSGAMMIDVNITGLNASTMTGGSTLNFTIMSSLSGESLMGGQFLAGIGNFFFDRSNTRAFSSPFFTGQVSSGTSLHDTWSMQAIVDRSIVEIFIQGGTQSGTLSYFSEYMLDTIIVKAQGVNQGATISVALWELNSAWQDQENSTGIVIGNNTGSVTKTNLFGNARLAI